MATPLPQPTTAITEVAAKFRPKVISRKGSTSSPVPGSRTGRIGTFGETPPFTPGTASKNAVPPLTTIALEALVKGFAVKPSLEGLPPRFATAFASMLPLDTDVSITAGHVEDELYWKRVCLEYKLWTRCDVSEHGGSWKQLFLEKYVAELLESFGLYPDLPPKYEEEFCRPAIDSTHPRWALLYPKTKSTRTDKRPVRERFSSNSLRDPDHFHDDVELATSGESGWPHLEYLKEIARANLPNYRRNFAWAAVDKAEFKALDHSASEAGISPPHSAAGGSAGVAASSTAGSGVNPLLLPFTMAAEHIRAEAETHAQREDDIIDSRATGDQLREFVVPGALDDFKRAAKWLGKRGDSILSIRQKELNALLSRIQCAADFVFNVVIEQLPSHLDLELVLSRLPNLTSLQLSYGMRHLGMKYERSLFGMRISDAESLARCMRLTDTISCLSLPCNMIDDNLLMILMSGLLDNRTIIHLDLSHNNITSAGIQLLSKLLRPPCVIASLNLADNKADERAARHLAKALRTNECLTELNLRLNDLGDEGGKALLDALQANTTLTTLNLSSNRLGAGTAAMAANLIANPECMLSSLDLSGNSLDEADAQILFKAMQSNKTITSLDLRGNPGIPEASESVQGIFQCTRQNEVKGRLQTELSYTS